MWSQSGNIQVRDSSPSVVQVAACTCVQVAGMSWGHSHSGHTEPHGSGSMGWVMVWIQPGRSQVLDSRPSVVQVGGNTSVQVEGMSWSRSSID